MDKAIKGYSRNMKLDELEIRRKLELDDKKEKMTTLSFHKKYGKFLEEEGKKLSSRILMYYATKTMRLGIYVMSIGILFIGIGLIIIYFIK
jgi:hypothetical protein